MAEDKKFADEIISDNELDGVAGGNRLETYLDGDELFKRGLLTAEQTLHSSPVRELLHQMGYAGYKDNGGLINANVYTDKNGKTITRDEFWKNFDAENGTSIIR